MSLQIRRLSHSLGAEIIGIDIRKPLDDLTFSWIHSAFLEHGILLFRGLPLTREQHIAFSRRFGQLDNNELAPRDRVAEYPEVLLVSNKRDPDGSPDARYKGGDVWHSDRAFALTPALASLLRGVEVPEVGGDTMFANMYLAYESLSDGMKKLLEGLYGVYVRGEKQIDHATPERLAERRRLSPPVAQPLVRVHPGTGRKSLYVGQRVKQLAGMSAEESRPLIQFLCQHAAHPQFVYRHQWRQHDLVIWDNRCMNHIGVGDYDKTSIRHMERTTVLGTPSGHIYEGAL